MTTLKRQESASLGCQRLLSSSIESAIRELTGKAGSGQAAADALRHAQAQFALIEPDLPKQAARRDRKLLDTIVSDIRQALRPAKLLGCLEKLASDYDVDLSVNPAKAFRKSLSKQAETVLALNTPNRCFDPLVYRLVADLAELRGQVGSWPEIELPEDRPPTGLRRSYTGARRAALNPPTTPQQAQRAATALSNLEAQLKMIGSCCKPMLKPQRKLIATATEIAEQREITLRLLTMLDTEDHRIWAEPILDAAHAKEAESRDFALLGSALAETPAAFSRRVGIYWQHWRSD